jgi:hypothetical protein
MNASLLLLKHPQHGAVHADPITAARLESEGWVRWPRTKAQKCAPPPAPAYGGGPGVPTGGGGPGVPTGGGGPGVPTGGGGPGVPTGGGGPGVPTGGGGPGVPTGGGGPGVPTGGGGPGVPTLEEQMSAAMAADKQSPVVPTFVKRK